MINFSEARSLYFKIFEELKIDRGDVIYLSVDMAKIPLPKIDVPLNREAIRQRQKSWCDFVLDTLMEKVGETGTVLMGAASNSYARYGTPYIHEETPSESSPLSEFMRQRSDVIRSFHPLLSVVGMGHHAQAILGDVGRSGFGIRSPYGKFREYGVKFLNLGTPADVLTYAYNLQQMYGLNHLYNKIFNFPVFRDGKQVLGPWFCYLRYLDGGLERDFKPLLERIEGQGCLRTSNIYNFPMYSYDVADVDRIGYQMLDENPWSLNNKKVEYHICTSKLDTPLAIEKAIYYQAIT